MTDKEVHPTSEAERVTGSGDLHHGGAAEGPPRGAHAMGIVRWILIAIMAAIAVASVVYSFGLVSPGSASAAETRYYCPMHPQVVQDHPGECPICSMSLVPKEIKGQKGLESRAPGTAGSAPPPSPSGAHAGHRHNPADPYFCPMHLEETGTDAGERCPICEMKLEKRPAPAMAPAPGMPGDVAQPQGVPGLVPVELSMDRIQLIGVRTAVASSESLVPELRTVGYVTADESRLARVHARFSGWIEQMAVKTTGQKVKRGQVLAGVFNLELLPAQQEFLAAQRWSPAPLPSSPSGSTAPLVNRLEQDARARLELFGLSPAEINSVAKTGKPVRTVAVTAPIAGHVVRRNVVQGSYVQPGTELFEIADLSKVWVIANVYEYEIGRVSVGQAATVVVGAYPEQPLSGKVTFIYPTVDAATRTLSVRIELDNQDFKLHPGMYGDVVIQLTSAQGVVVPWEALVDTGEYQYVFLAKEGGHFEPRRVSAGARSGEKVQILQGLSAGETVVTTANFLIDSESRLRAAIEGTADPGGAPAPSGTPSACDADFDKLKFSGKHAQCRQCELVHRGMGSMEQDCKNAIPRPWR